jgi:predicted dinucleotide-binding enzyme
MKISVLGAGNIGGTLGQQWARQGHDVIFGVRNTQAAKVQRLLGSTEGRATAASIPDSISAGEVILFAIPSLAVDSIVAAQATALTGKIVIDATNRFDLAVMHNLSVFDRYAPEVSYFRAFNALGWENFAEPELGGQQIDLFYCGDSGPAQEKVERLIADVGLRPIYVGGREQLPVVDGLTRLWFALAIQRGLGRRLAFKMLMP